MSIDVNAELVYGYKLSQIKETEELYVICKKYNIGYIVEDIYTDSAIFIGNFITTDKFNLSNLQELCKSPVVFNICRAYTEIMGTPPEEAPCFHLVTRWW